MALQSEILTRRPAPLPAERSPACLRGRISLWCELWSGVADSYDMEALRPLAGDGPLQMMNDFGCDIAMTTSFDAYSELWVPLLTETYRYWDVHPVSDVTLKQWDGIASATFFTRFTGVTHEGTRDSRTQAVSHIWERLGGIWRLTHEHTTVDEAGRSA